MSGNTSVSKRSNAKPRTAKFDAVGVTPGSSPGVSAFYRSTNPLANPESHPIS
jgi:hypothetical protein